MDRAVTEQDEAAAREALRAAIRASGERPRPDPRAQAAYVLRMHLLERIDGALRAAGLRALLVKGAALAHTVYATPWARDMVDVDLIAPTGALDRVVAALAASGLAAQTREGERPWSGRAFGEAVLTARFGGASLLVEVHAHLDKVVPRPVDHAAIFRRARTLDGLPALLAPSLEDHLLLVALHLAASELRHPVAFVDLERILRAGPDLEAVAKRAHAFRLATATWMALVTLRALGSEVVPAGLVRALRPSPLRRAAIARHYRIGHYPAAKGPFRLGWPWIVRQTALRDDVGAWLAGVARYAALRGAERTALARAVSAW